MLDDAFESLGQTVGIQRVPSCDERAALQAVALVAGQQSFRHLANVQALGDAVGIPVHIAPGRGHMLGEDYVGPLLDRWLR